MAEETPVPRRDRNLLIGSLALLLLIVVLVAAGVVVWYTVIDDLEVPDLISFGDDAGSEQTRRDRSQEPEGQHDMDRTEDPLGETPAPSQESLIVPQELKLVDIIPSPRIVHFNGPGQSQQLTVRGFYSDGSTGELELEPGDEFLFATTDSSVARVSPDGVIESLTVGGVDVLVAYRDFEAEVPVLVWGEVRQVPPIDPDALFPIDDGSAIVLNRVITRLKDGYALGDATAIAASVGGEIIFELEFFPGYLIELDSYSKGSLERALTILRSDPRISHAYPDQVVSLSQTPTPDIETLHNSGNIDTNYLLQTNLHKAWEVMHDRAPGIALKYVTIAVIDSDFPDRDSSNAFLRNEFELGYFTVRDLVSGNSHPDHGVAVTSVIVAKNNIPPSKGGFSGIVTSVHKLPYSVLFYGVAEADFNGATFDPDEIVSSFTFLYSLNQLRRYDDPIDVVNLSFAIKCHVPRGFDCGLQDDLYDQIKQMPTTTFVVAAGNAKDGTPRDIIDENIIPASFSVERNGRKALDNVITVGGLTPTNEWHPSSNYGKGITLAAPYEVWTMDFPNSGYSLENGTSFSAPLVTGTVALLRALNRKLSPGDIKNLLVDSAQKVDVCVPNSDKATPTPSRCPTGMHATTWNLLNVKLAVQMALGQLPTQQTDAASALPTIAPRSTSTPSGTTRPSSVSTQSVAATPAATQIAQSTLMPTTSANALTPSQTSALTDRTALEAFFNSTRGRNWMERENWLSDMPMGEWYGVTTNSEGRVISIVLEDNAVGGELPPELGNLTELRVLNLSNIEFVSLGNQLTGRIPPTIGNLGKLTELSLRWHAMSGEIPSELGRLTNLEVLNLGMNIDTLAEPKRSKTGFSGQIPPELGNLTNLRTLDLAENLLTGEIPQQLGNLVNLRFLALSKNRLTGAIPEELGNLVNLQFLYLSDLSTGNQLGCMPNSTRRLGLVNFVVPVYC